MRHFLNFLKELQCEGGVEDQQAVGYHHATQSVVWRPAAAAVSSGCWLELLNLRPPPDLIQDLHLDKISTWCECPSKCENHDSVTMHFSCSLIICFIYFFISLLSTPGQLVQVHTEGTVDRASMKILRKQDLSCSLLFHYKQNSYRIAKTKLDTCGMSK